MKYISKQPLFSFSFSCLFDFNTIPYNIRAVSALFIFLLFMSCMVLLLKPLLVLLSFKLLLVNLNKPFENETIGASGFYKRTTKDWAGFFESKQRKIPKRNHASNQKDSRTFDVLIQWNVTNNINISCVIENSENLDFLKELIRSLR